jgi:post-segregation antitoxin (ccd killing protein)
LWGHIPHTPKLQLLVRFDYVIVWSLVRINHLSIQNVIPLPRINDNYGESIDLEISTDRGLLIYLTCDDTVNTLLSPQVVKFIITMNVVMIMEWVTVSTKVRREIWEMARRYNINVSEVLRRALEQEISRREEEEARASARRIVGELKVSEEEVARLIREGRDDR